jgi:hypothetical protein
MAEYDQKPHEDDLRSEDNEYNPAIEPKSAKAWINLLTESEDAFEDWNNHCDMIDRQYASLAKLAQMGRDKEFQMFWANAEVLKPSIYAKPPIPVVVPKFKDRRPVYQQASEVMERCCNVAFDLARINDLMLLVRDDLSMNSRGVAWCRYESGGKKSDYDHEKVCIDFKGRRDFLHSISRNWREVTWVAAASYLTRSEARKRFSDYSGDAYQEAEYKVDKDAKEIGGADNRERAKFWEIWDKGSRRVVWVAEGCEDILDEDDAHLDLQNYFPCPKPCYGTVQRGSLIPVPDVLQYRDQLDEINQLTGRIHALADALQVKGFYPAGGGEAADAIQTALKLNSPNEVMVPISNWAAFGQSKEIILWMPIDQIAQTILHLVTLRKQIIEDIYQIMGLSDIMRGATDPNETLGAQQLKTQYGSTRIRDKQQEMVRFAKDLVEITSEIITEKFKDVTIIEMSQTQLPTKEMQLKKAKQLKFQIEQNMAQLQQLQQQPPPQQPPQGATPAAPPPPDPTTQLNQQIQQQVTELQQLAEEPTTDQVLKFLKDNRAKSFVLDIETDSTIMADENAEKQRRTEFVGMLSTLLPQLSQMITAEPQTAEFCGEVLKFALAPYRAGRALDGQIDGLVEQMQAKGQQGRGEDPTTAQHRILLQIEQMKQDTAKQKNQADALLKVKELEQKDQHKKWELEAQLAMKQEELNAKARDGEGKAAVQNLKAMENREAHQAHMMENTQKMELDRQKAEVAMRLKQQDHSNKAAAAQMAAQAKQQNGGLV